MKLWRVFLLFVALVSLLLLAGPSRTAAPILVTGDNTVEAAIDLSGSDRIEYIWGGERLTRPAMGDIRSSSEPDAGVLLSTAVYTGTLAPVAARLGTSVKAVLYTSKLFNPIGILTGQRLTTPTAKATPTLPPPTGKWIDVDIGSQTITAYQGSAPLKTVLMSSGVGMRWTPLGSFKVYLKVQSQTMSGGVGESRYYLPGVPWILYFSGDIAIHGTYWHNNFGTPMSHGCVNVSIQDVKWFYDWAAVGTPVVVHM